MKDQQHKVTEISTHFQGRTFSLREGRMSCKFLAYISRSPFNFLGSSPIHSFEPGGKSKTLNLGRRNVKLVMQNSILSVFAQGMKHPTSRFESGPLFRVAQRFSKK